MTLFRNFRVWQLDAPIRDALESDRTMQLEDAVFAPCGPGQVESMGWEEVLPEQGLRRDLSDAAFLKARIQERVLPSAAIAEVLTDRIEEVEAREGAPVRGARRRELADEVRASLIPKAPLKSSRQWLCIDHEQALAMVDTTTLARGEAVLSMLRGCLGSLPLRPLAFAHPLDGVLTAWLRTGDLPSGFSLGEWCDLQHPQDTANTVKLRGQQLDEDEVPAMLDRGMRVTALELVWEVDADAPLKFVIGEDGSFRRVSVPWEYGGDLDVEDEASRMDADLTLVVLSMRRLFAALFPALGGRVVE